MDLADIYAGQLDDVAGLLDAASTADAPGGAADAPVPACPGWRVRDVVVHVAELARDAATGNLPVMDLLEQWRDDDVAAVRDAMTAGQVRRGPDRPLDQVVDDWRTVCAALRPMLDGTVPFPEPAPVGLSMILISDLVVHEQDVRGALGAPRSSPGPAWSIALATYGFSLDYRIRQTGAGALRLRFDGEERVYGDGPPAATLTADRFDLVRALGGRRSRGQILAFGWEGDPGAYLPLIPAYGERADDLVE